ncbi:putative glutaredoxin [Xylariomycetidae sp. FL2044]|nr:putative glutaredoxin [Xylariomycetidae sp. FL2044]
MNFVRRFFTTTSPAAMASAKEKAQTIIDENAVAVFSKSYCPYCRASKQLLDSVGAKYYAIELDKEADGADIQSALEEISGQRTVPNIYIAKKHIGGNSDLQAKSGQLKSLLTDAGAL